MSNYNFKKEDRVYVANIGWGIIRGISDSEGNALVLFNDFLTRSIPLEFLSYEEYGFESSFIQMNVNEMIGKIGYFYDSSNRNILISRLIAYDNSKEYPFQSDLMIYQGDGEAEAVSFEIFKPLSEEEIKSLPTKI